jgi:uncharacterized membrane protein YcaP (DUF421 family)
MLGHSSGGSSMLMSDYREDLRDRAETMARISKVEVALIRMEGQLGLLMDEREQRRKKEMQTFDREANILMLLMGVCTAVISFTILR